MSTALQSIRHKVLLALLSGWREGYEKGEVIPESEVTMLRADAVQFAAWYLPRYESANGAGAMLLTRALHNGAVIDEFYRWRRIAAEEDEG